MIAFKPEKVSDLEVAFAANVTRLMPPYAEIPEEFKDGRTPQNHLFRRLFYCGGKLSFLKEKSGIDRNDAIRHIKTVMASWEPKHEHKEAAVAYLFSLWFEPITKEQVDANTNAFAK